MSKESEKAARDSKSVLNDELDSETTYEEEMINRSIVHGRQDLSLIAFLLDSIINILKGIRLILFLIIVLLAYVSYNLL